MSNWKMIYSLWKTKIVFVILVGLIISLFLFSDGLIEKIMPGSSTKIKNTEVIVWVNLERQVAFIDKNSGNVVMIMESDLAKKVMIAQLKLYEFEELQALKKGE